MKGLLIFKPILTSIIEHSDLDSFGQFLLMSRHVEKMFEKVVEQLKSDLRLVKLFKLKDVKYQTHTLCLIAVKAWGSSLKYVQKQTDEICLAAVNTYPYAYEFVKNPTNEMLNVVRRFEKYIMFKNLGE